MALSSKRPIMDGRLEFVKSTQENADGSVIDCIDVYTFSPQFLLPRKFCRYYPSTLELSILDVFIGSEIQISLIRCIDYDLFRNIVESINRFHIFFEDSQYTAYMIDCIRRMEESNLKIKKRR